jgi:hypothetical protein
LAGTLTAVAAPIAARADAATGAATAWVYQQMQAIAATSGGRTTVQQQTFTQQPVAGRIPVPAVITNVIATLQGTASPKR